MSSVGDDDSVLPQCILKPKETALRKQLIKVNFLLKGVKGFEDYRKPHRKWVVEGSDCNLWRQNTIDDRTVYNLNAESLKDAREFPLRSRPPSADPLSARPNSCRNLLERQYTHSQITANAIERLDNRRFRKTAVLQVIKPRGAGAASYGAPTATNARSVGDLVRLMQRPPSTLRVTLPGVHRCGSGEHVRRSQFCEVLGPIACQRCIEKNNRRAIREVHENAFPEIDCSLTSLVAPGLAAVMVGRHGDSRRSGKQRQKRQQTT